MLDRRKQALAKPPNNNKRRNGARPSRDCIEPSHNKSCAGFEESGRVATPDADERIRIEFTSEYKKEFERLLAMGKRLEKAVKAAKAEYRQWERALLRHIESRHYTRA